ncbi:MAG TPA: hypothetical protein PKJ91_05295 [Methanoregulaceae archaeon]|jgi:hypothetical protein|nr:hypothetical protein [Methanoregulaceae archaeon]HNW80867.1 hypothetical protein [Methanoregulaceae archaeon]
MFTPVLLSKQDTANPVPQWLNPGIITLQRMKKVALRLALSFLILFLVVSGCTQAPVTPPVTSPPTTVIPTTPAPVTTTLPVGMGTPGPTQSLPPQYSLTFQVTTNGRTTDPITSVALNGGNGMNFVGLIEVSLTKPDGAVQSQTMNSPHFMGQNVAFPCSTFQNRVEIWATAPEVGRIKVYDEIVPFKSLNP